MGAKKKAATRTTALAVPPKKPDFIQQIDTLFEFVEMKLKDAIWTMKLRLKETGIEEVYSQYVVKFTLNREPHEEAIKRATEQVARVEADKQLFEDRYKGDIKNAKQAVSDAEAELEKNAAAYPDIELPATVVKVEHKWNGTVLVMEVRADDVSLIDTHKTALMPRNTKSDPIYKVVLTH